MTIRRLLPVLLLAAMALPQTAHGHARQHSYSSWRMEAQGARVHLRIARNLTGRDGRRVARQLQLLVGEEPCQPRGTPSVQPVTADWVIFSWDLECPPGESRVIRNRMLRVLGPTHLHFARVILPDGTDEERILSSAQEEWVLTGPATGPGSAVEGMSWLEYLELGIEHILTGWDHLAFVLALLLLAGSLREVATLVTGFTLAHSVTLGLAAVGLLRPDAVAVEALIGFSIALVASENAWILAGRDRTLPWLIAGMLGIQTGLAALGYGALRPLLLVGTTLFTVCHFQLLRLSARPERLRVLVAFGFGLVHGFGFAGVLAETGLPAGRLLPALFGFNAGVEVGQLAVVFLVWPGLRVLVRFGEARCYRPAAELGSAAICGLGLFWFLVRAYG
ncbi:MAG: HupE/UreJ family protein [Myxococcota bacterium]